MKIKLQAGFEWLEKESGPKILLEALALYGTKEKAGEENNPAIMQWVDECGIPRSSYFADSVPWCGLFAAICSKRAGKQVPQKPLWARNWLNFGEACEPHLGCILVFERGAESGHVGIYVGENKYYFFVLGGNQGDEVKIVPIAKKRLLGARCSYKNKPENARAIELNIVTGAVSNNEA